MNNTSNSTLCNNESICEIPAPLFLNQVYACFVSLLSFNAFTFMSFFLWTTSFTFNLTLIVILSMRKKLNIFEKIFILHALIDFLINLLDFSFVIIFTIIPFWPFSSQLCVYYTSVDNALSSIEIFTVMYMCWVRMRCIQAPKTYTNELVIKHFLKIHMSIWAVLVVLWTITSEYILEINEWFDQSYCQLTFGSNWLNIFLLVTLFLLPLSLIGFMVIYIFFLIRKTNSNVKDIKAKKNKGNFFQNPLKYLLALHTSPQTKLVIITLAFLSQYSPFYVTWLISLLCTECVSSQAFAWINYLAYCPSLVNPIVIFTLNFKSRKIA